MKSMLCYDNYHDLSSITVLEELNVWLEIKKTPKYSVLLLWHYKCLIFEWHNAELNYHTNYFYFIFLF